MKNKIVTMSFREIKKNFKRFLSLVVLSFLGVSIFVGIKMASPDMITTLDKYYRDNKTYDIKVISTLGLTSDDIKELNKLDEKFNAYGLHSKDVEISTNINNNTAVIKVLEISNDINKLILNQGRLPKNKNEIVVESSLLPKMQLNLGDTITLNTDEESIENKELQIVGTITNPIYLLNGNGNLNRGNTTIGNGSIKFYTYALSEFFDMDYYTEIYVSVENKYQTNSNDYNKIIDEAIEKIESIKENREKERYNQIVNEANKEIEKQEKEALQEFETAKEQLDDANKKLIGGKNTLKNSKNELKEAKQKIDAGKQEIDNGYKQIDIAKKELESAKRELDSGVQKINKELEQYDLKYEDILLIKEALEGRILTREEAISIVPKSGKYYEEIIQIINYIYDNDYYKTVLKYIKEFNMDKVISIIPTDIDNYNEVVDYIRSINIEKIRNKIINYFLDKANVEKIKELIPKNSIGYDRIINYLDKYEITINNILELFNGVKKLKDGYSEYNANLKLVQENKEKLDSAYNEYITFLEEYNAGLQKYKDGEKEYNSNLNLYNSNLEEYNARLFEFEDNIKKAKEDVNSIEKAKWFIYTRMDNSEYASYIDSSNSVCKLSYVFPAIFFAVAIFISLLSMSRMAFEDRGEIGTLKSLGFSNMAIRSKYIIYSLIATIIGGIIGILFGENIIPKLIIEAYKMMYEMPIFEKSTDLLPIFIGIIISILCICGATIITINGLVREKTTELLRPKAPVQGKKILFEKIKFIWQKISFSNKITVRNIFRYKKRVGMTILGIVGCTVLLLSGYAIRDSIVNIADVQYDEVFNFDELVYLDGNINKQSLDEIFKNSHIKEKVYTQMSNIIVDSKSVNLLVPEDENALSKIITLNDKDTNEKLSFENNKVIITSKLAKLLKLKTNDTIKFTDSKNKTYSFVISGIAQNYIGNYIYMNKQTYEDKIEKFAVNIAYLNIDDKAIEEPLIEELLANNKNILSAVSSQDTLERVSKMFKSLDSIVLILVFFSGALSFVVLYNLTYINISERQRERATLKVLGFNHKEIDGYILKEEIIITIIGILIGLLAGTWFGLLIVETIELEIVEFIKNITPLSYIKAFGFMILFSVIVNIRVHFTLKKIDMIESLKSVE